MTDYPIPVARYEGASAFVIVCESCGTEATIGPDALTSDGSYACPRNWDAPIVRWDERHKLPCPDGHAVHKYQEADPCPGCGKLGWWDVGDDNACSRRCQLQAEYARSLGGAA